MEVHKGLEQLPVFDNAVLTIGSFDGVHHGHRAIISKLIEKASSINGESIILTFDPHPRQVVSPNDKEMRLLNTLEEKIALLSETGLDHLIVMPFTIEFSQINPYKYIEDILIDKINVKHLIIGYDHRFGQNRTGNIELLQSYAAKGAFSVEEISQQDIDDLAVSSTKVRNYIAKGDMPHANKLLTKTYSLNGTVTKGSQIAGKLGYPTANCDISEKIKLIPAPGTYAATAVCDGISYEGMLYIGKSPTLQGLTTDIIEMNLFGSVSDDLYDKKIVIYPEQQFRGDKRFDSVDELMFNIGADKNAVLHYFKNQKSKSIITTAILNYNGQEHLKNYLPSHEPSVDHDVVVFDNASTDESVSYTQEHFTSVNVVNLTENTGYAGGYNNAIKTIGSKYVALVNSDVRVTPSWLDPIITLMDSDDQVAAVQPKILSIEQPAEFEYAGAAGGFIDTLGYPLCRGRILDTVEKDNKQYDEPSEIFWASGAAIVMRTDLYIYAGGLDSDFFAHMEEIDLCWRLKSAGYKIMYEPRSVIYHLGGGTLTYDSPKKVYLNLRNNYWMIRKNLPLGSLLYKIPLRICIDIAYSFLFLLKGKVSHFGSAIKGILQGLGSLGVISKKKKEQQYFINRHSVGSKNESGKLSSILPFSYFILGKKKFSDYR